MIPAATIKEEPAGAARYLLPNEDCVAMVRRHPAVLLPASAYAVAGLLGAFILSATLLRGHTTLIWIVWGLWGLLMVRLIWQAINAISTVDPSLTCADMLSRVQSARCSRPTRSAAVKSDGHEFPPVFCRPIDGLRRIRGRVSRPGSGFAHDRPYSLSGGPLPQGL